MNDMNIPQSAAPTAPFRQGGLERELEEMTPEQLGGEIRLLTAQARKIVLYIAVQIGHRLTLAKEKVAHGEWMDWVARETTLSQSNVNRMMRLYAEYGSRQENLFEAELNSSTLTNLSVSNALQLLAFPAEERETVAKELDAEHVSSRDLAEAIAARKAAEEQADELRRELDELEEGHGLAMAELTDRMREMEDDAARGKEAIKERSSLLDKLGMAAQTEKNLREQIRELEERPIEVAVERDEKAIEEAARTAKAKAEAEAAEKINALQKKLEKAEAARDKLKDAAGKAESGAADKIAAAERDAAAARQELEAMRKQLAASDRDVTEFILHSKTAQASLQAMLDGLTAIGPKNPETARKLNAGLKLLVERIGARCAEIEAGFAKEEERIATTPAEPRNDSGEGQG